jgi:gliding motility-associated-like protein
VATVSSDITYYLKASTLEGCESFDTINIKIYKGPDIYTPSAFTPNQDGLNDVLKPFNVGLKRFDYFTVFNRFGDVVFSTKSNREGWNGKYMQKDQPTGTYVWIVSGLDYSGKTIAKKGTVILIR